MQHGQQCCLLFVLECSCDHISPSPSGCVPSATHVCVKHDGSVFLINKGSGYISRGSIPVTTASVSLEFEIENGPYPSHPLYVTDSTTGGGNGVVYSSIITNGSMTVVVNSTMLQGGVYYQCHTHAAMGGRITSAAAASPTVTVLTMSALLLLAAGLIHMA